MTGKEAAIRVIRTLQGKGFEALLAGGCVRDMLLRRRAKDYDVATDARPRDVTRSFRRTLKVGAKFGVVIVLMGARQVEVATFRSDSGYVDGRHPGAVEFTNAAKDAARRDFTINGMFYDPVRREVIDYVGGRADLKKRVVRTIGRAEDRFGEDHLRMLRAVRFSTDLGFAIERATWMAIRGNAENISRISAERIAMELESILTSPNRAAGASMVIESGLASSIFEGFGGREADVAVCVLGKLPKRVDFALALAGFFAGFEMESAGRKCRVLKLSRNRTRHIAFLLSNRGRLLRYDMSLAALKTILAEPYFEDLYDLEKAIQKAGGRGRGVLVPLIKLRKRINALGDVELRPKPLLNGHDLMRLGAVAGPGLGQLAEELYVAQLEGAVRTAEQARLWAREWLEKHRTIDK